MDELNKKRREKQPLEMPSAGSVFKRPQNGYASKLIEDCGLKGYTLGGAQVSEKHSGFIVNRGGATCADVLKLIEYVQKVVEDKTGIFLEPEVKLVSLKNKG
jgi:UDP-N-acetylmuramate dehydrogenase